MTREQNLCRAIDELAAKWDISGFYAATERGKTLLHRTYGYADRAAGTRMTEANTYCVALETEAFLGVAALLLEEDGKLRLTDRLDRWIPEYRFSDRIQLLQLFHGTSGVPDYLHGVVQKNLEHDETHQALSEEERFVREREIASAGFAFTDVLSALNGLELECEPGVRTRETESARHLLAESIRRASGMSLYAFLNARVFEPLGMCVREGNCADTATYAAFRESTLLRMKNTAGKDLATWSADDCIRLASTFAEGKILSARSWKKALKYTEEGVGIGFSALNGAAGIYIDGPFGYSFSIGFNQATRFSYLSVLSEGAVVRRVRSNWRVFRPEARREIEGYVQRLTSPKLVRANESNIWQALELTVTEKQENFVMSAPDSLAACCAVPGWRPYVLMDQGRAIGLLVLEILPKRAAYDIAIVLIDRRFQGRGYGSFMVRQAVEMLQKAGAKHLEIGVNRFNPVARRLYESVGFRACDVYDDGVRLSMEL